MKHYIGTYSFKGDFRQQKDDFIILIVSEFSYDGKYYRPSNPLYFIIQDRNEGKGWVSVKDEMIGVRIGGDTLKEALGNAFMMAVDQYEDLGFTDMPLTKRAQTIRENFCSWKVHDIDKLAQ
jgi:hypothetical protein